MADMDTIFKEALALQPTEKAELIDKLISSLDKPDKELDKAWAKEAEDRIDAFESGNIRSVSLETVLSKYSKK